MIIRSCLVGFAALAVAFAQAQAKPKFWIWDKANGTFTADNALSRDPRFREVVAYHMQWGISHPVSGGDNLATRSGSATGARIGQEVIARGNRTSETTIFINFFGLRGLETADRTGYFSYGWGNHPDEGESVNPSLYANPADMIWVQYASGGRLERTPWATTGMENVKNWMVDFLTAYNATGAPRPKRLIFDQEIPVSVMAMSSWEDIYKYWKTLRESGDWSGRPVPGFGGQKMEQIWANRPLGVEFPELLPSPNEPGRYKGGSAKNQRWYSWFVGLWGKVYAAMLDYAVFGKVDAYWPGTTCGDYNSTIQLDGANGEYGVPANTIMDGSYTGILGDQGMRYAWEAPGTNIFNNPNFYNAANGWIWNAFKTNNANSWERWANTDDTHNPTYGLVADGRHGPRGTADGDEFWSDTIARMNRFYADGLVRSTSSVGKDTVAWITLPNQMHYLPAILDYDGVHYPVAPWVREPLSSTYRTLAMCRARGINEFMLWFDTGYDVDTIWGNYNRGLHGNYKENWNKLRRAVDLVWAYSPTDFYVTGVLPQGLSDAVKLQRIGTSDLNYSDLGAKTVEVQSNPSAGLWAVTAFKNTMGVSAPQFLNFEYEVRLDMATSASLFVYDAAHGAWLSIGATGDVKDQDGRIYPVSVAKHKTMRLRARIAYNSDFVDSSGKIRVAFSTPSEGSTTTGYFDLTQCYGSDEGLRQNGDWNGDGIVSAEDDTLFHAMWDRYQDPAILPADKAMAGMWNLDLDHNGVIEIRDLKLWNALWDDGDDPEYPEDRPNWRWEYIDDARQIANDTRPRP